MVVLQATKEDILHSHMETVSKYIQLHYKDEFEMMMNISQSYAYGEAMDIPIIQSFSSYLFSLIDERGFDEVYIYIRKHKSIESCFLR